MRLDKFLWAVRYYKTRNQAAEACKKNQVKVNGEVSKASKEMMPGDVVHCKKNQMVYQFKVIQIPKNRMGAKAVSLYIVDQTPQEEYDKLELRKLSQDYYRHKGEGRPTKKDRREIDDFLSPEEEE